jgi:tRNA (guanine-N7-)-methyltransferase
LTAVPKARNFNAMIITVTDPCKPLPIAFDPARPLEVEVGCGKGRFLTGRAAANPQTDFLGIERMLGRVHSFDDKCRRLKISNAHVLRLEALYTFWYLLPAHSVRTVYVFFPDPWPKKKHHSHRLFGPMFLKALWKRLAPGGKLEFATDHEEYFRYVTEECFPQFETTAGETPRTAPAFVRVPPMERPPEAWTEFETRFRGQGLPIYSAAWQAAECEDYELGPMTVAPEDEPREGIARRIGKRYLREMEAAGEIQDT